MLLNARGLGAITIAIANLSTHAQLQAQCKAQEQKKILGDCKLQIELHAVWKRQSRALPAQSDRDLLLLLRGHPDCAIVCFAEEFSSMRIHATGVELLAACRAS